MKYFFFSFISLALLLFSSSCTKDKTQADTSVNYPAAYVINANSNSITIINTSTNQAVDRIDLPTANSFLSKEM